MGGGVGGGGGGGGVVVVEWHIYASLEHTIIGSDNGLSRGRHQAIIWTNASILLIGSFGNKLQWNHNRNWYIFIQENVVWKMVAILSRPQCVNHREHRGKAMYISLIDF